MQITRKLLILPLICTILWSCGKHEMSEHERKEANTPAGKVGQLAYKAAQESNKAAKVAGKELSKAAREAHEGWKEASEKDKAKQ